MKLTCSAALCAAMVTVSSVATAQSWNADLAMLPAAVEAAATPKAQLAHKRPDLLARMTLGVTCFPDNLTEEEMNAVLEQYGALPPTQFAPTDERYFTDSLVWTGDVSIGSSAQAARANLTYSFPNDGTTWGLSAISSTGPNDLNARFTTLFGAGNVDRGRELIRQALASWRRYGGLTYQEVADDNVAMNQTTARTAARGDVRIGGLGFGTGTFLAYDAFPSASGLAGVGGADMCLNTSFFIGSAFSSATNNYRYLRNTASHEHGHGLGFIHTVPCDSTKTMEPFIFTTLDMLQVDERRGAGRSYGDRYSGNNSAANAKNFGNLTTPVLKSIIERDLSTNGSTGPNDSDEDWFKFTIDSTQPITITVAPTGGSYVNGQQSSSCSGSTSTINALAAGNLNIELRDAAGTTVLQTAAAAAAGSNEVLSAGSRSAGTYTVRVFDVGPNSNQIVQLYDLTIRVAAATAPPQAIAGLHKRIGANAVCYFMGDINSAANEGALSSPSAFDWDLDGDGSFEVNDNAQPNRQYVSNGVYPVTLRVTDSGNMVSRDTINVTVFGATTTVTGAAPGAGNQGASVPVTIAGTNLKNLTLSSMVTVSGSGVSVSGTPVPNVLGTSVSGLSFVISGGAAAGPRNVTVTNSDGTGTGNGLFVVNAAPPAVPGPFSLLAPANGSTVLSTAPVLSWGSSADATGYDVKVDDDPAFLTPEFSTSIAGTSVGVPLGALNYKIRYYWSVVATNVQGSTASTPSSFSFRTPPCAGDANYDKSVNFLDITKILEAYGATYPAGESGLGDSSNNDSVEFGDVTESLNFFGNTCP